jgi:hypothetical protein
MTDQMRPDPSIAALRSIDPARRMPAEQPGAREATRDAILRSSPGETAALGSDLGMRSSQRRGRRRLVLAGVAALAVAALVVTLSVALRQAPPAAAAVEFRTSGDYIVATVVNPYAAEQQLDAAFAAHGLHITLKLVPVSPSLVGSVVYMGSSADASGIGVLYSPTRQAPGGPLPIGLRIPTDFQGRADIVLGRAARPNETYVSTADAFAPGEALHGSGLIGMRVSAALAKLKELGLTAQWRELRPSKTKPGTATLPTPVASPAPGVSPAPGQSAKPVPMESVFVDPATIRNNVVIGADPLAPGKVVILTQKPARQ